MDITVSCDIPGANLNGNLIGTLASVETLNPENITMKRRAYIALRIIPPAGSIKRQNYSIFKIKFKAD
jgi:hypothetical protein